MSGGLAHELVVDNFAGGGGASLGIEQALGRSPDIAVNHDPEAVAMHAANHPDTRHYCESVWDIDPLQVCGGRPVGLAWFSPDCKHFSKAKGGRPVEKKIRGLAWIVVRWAKLVRPRVIILENVEEFRTWGPLTEDGRPCPIRKGRTFRRWLGSLRAQGYVVETRELRACDYGVPTTRKRLFVIARCDGQPIIWPEPTHGPGRSRPYRTAAECIEWSIPCLSIFERKKPLAEKTQQRIARGLQRYVIGAAEPFIVGVGGPTYSGKPTSVNKPFGTLTTENHRAVVVPYVMPMQHENRSTGVDEPLQTVTTQENKFNLVATTLIQTGYGERPTLWRCGACEYVYDRGDLPTCGCNRCGSDADPLEIPGQAPRVPGLDKPLGTVVAGGVKHALVAAWLAKHNDGHAATGQQLSIPLHTVTAKDNKALMASSIVKLKGTCRDGQPVTEPLHTVQAGGLHYGEVRAFFIKFYGQGWGQDLLDPLHTVTAKDRFALVTIQGELYAIADICMRMLVPRELYRAQGFSDSYVICPLFNGKPLSAKAQVRMAGNSVCPDLAELLVRANYVVAVQGAA